MFLSDELYTALNVSAITSLLDSYGSGVALFSDVMIPEDFTGNSSINYYLSLPFDPRTEYEFATYTINCRDKSTNLSQTIAYTVVDNINRVHYTDYYITGMVFTTIPPFDETDNFNTPVEVLIRKK